MNHRQKEEDHPTSRRVLMLIYECRRAWNQFFALACKKDTAAARGDGDAVDRYSLALQKLDVSLADSERRLAQATKEETRDLSRDWREQVWAKRAT